MPGAGGGGLGRDGGGEEEKNHTETFSSFYQQPCKEYCSAWHKSSTENSCLRAGCQPLPEITSTWRHWCLCGPVTVPIVPQPIAWGILFPAFVSPGSLLFAFTYHSIPSSLCLSLSEPARGCGLVPRKTIAYPLPTHSPTLSHTPIIPRPLPRGANRSQRGAV